MVVEKELNAARSYPFKMNRAGLHNSLRATSGVTLPAVCWRDPRNHKPWEGTFRYREKLLSRHSAGKSHILIYVKILPRAQKSSNPPLRIGDKIVNPPQSGRKIFSNALDSVLDNILFCLEPETCQIIC